MSSPIIEVRNLSKLYHLGQIGTASIKEIGSGLWDKIRGRKHIIHHSAAAHPEVDPEQTGPLPNSFWAIKDINLDVHAGDVLGIIGSNGAGKSTLLKILSRITEPTSGHVKMRGRVASLLEVGTGFHDDLTGRHNIYLNGAILGMSRREIDKKLDEIVDFSGVEKFIDTPVKRYSSGMRVRLAFAVAAHLEPEILILDEVLAVGDAEFQEKCIYKIRELGRSEGRAVIFVSHSMASVSALCSKAVWLRKGRVINFGQPQDLIEQYLHSLKGGVFQGDQCSVYSRPPVDDDFKPMQITRIGVQNALGSATGHLAWDEQVALTIEILNRRWVAGSIIGYYLTDKRGRKVFTDNCETWPDGSVSSQYISVIVRIPKSFLVPGRYTASFVLSARRQSQIDSVLNAVEFSIGNEGSPFHEFLGTDYGCVFAPCSWEISPGQTVSSPN